MKSDTATLQSTSSPSSERVGTALGRRLFDQREELDYHYSVDFDTLICSAVEAGSKEMLYRHLAAPQQGRVGRMSLNELRQSKYSFVCLATLITRAAIRGGLPSETSFNLSDLYCQRADLLGEVADVERLTVVMMEDFCDKVHEVKKRGDVSRVVQTCLDYISIHLHEPLGLEILSGECCLCSRSLSLRFKKEVGIGIPEYIHREKMQEAQYLLHHTDLSLSQISQYLGYPSQSHFTQIFKKYCGRTPQRYRDQIP